ncbi:hypothetical protein Q5P01_018883 [Channa striata]|uniref:Uncharacterized protein n=1 Tax=Channa striata TaxID=64152 RepID=A0AA88M8U2_CHASR|nr:hypothetical protein Q5P01_018883 [Channa striata]
MCHVPPDLSSRGCFFTTTTPVKNILHLHIYSNTDRKPFDINLSVFRGKSDRNFLFYTRRKNYFHIRLTSFLKRALSGCYRRFVRCEIYFPWVGSSSLFQVEEKNCVFATRRTREPPLTVSRYKYGGLATPEVEARVNHFDRWCPDIQTVADRNLQPEIAHVVKEPILPDKPIDTCMLQ